MFVMPPPPPQPTTKKESDVARKTSPIAFIARRLLLPTRFLRSAKTLPNKPKLGKDGAFKMVSSEEKRPARWVRNLTSISVVKVAP